MRGHIRYIVLKTRLQQVPDPNNSNLQLNVLACDSKAPLVKSGSMSTPVKSSRAFALLWLYTCVSWLLKLYHNFLKRGGVEEHEDRDQ